MENEAEVRDGLIAFHPLIFVIFSCANSLGCRCGKFKWCLTNNDDI